MKLSDSVNKLKGIGPKTYEAFLGAGIESVDDLINFYPSSYEVYEEPVSISEADIGKTVTVFGRLIRPSQKGSRKLPVTMATLQDEYNKVFITWFRMPWLINKLRSFGGAYLRGVIEENDGLLKMTQPEIFFSREEYEKKQGIMQPKYPLKGKLKNHQLLKAIEDAFSKGYQSDETLPGEIIKEMDLYEKSAAQRNMHFPSSVDEFKMARKRLVFEEFFYFSILLKIIKSKGPTRKNTCIMEKKEDFDKYINSLSFELTSAQKRVTNEILKDLKSKFAMNRLIEGDVGSGKTVVAILSLITAVNNGYQGAMLAPTEVLASQHAEGIKKAFLEAEININVVLLTGSLKEKEKEKVREQIKSGDAKIIVGTHAIITDKVTYKNLGLVVTDEQHRFGVKQREVFMEKGINPHVLVMSATPIPRTLALILYGDMSLSVLDEKPANRLPIKNCVIPPSKRGVSYKFINY